MLKGNKVKSCARNGHAVGGTYRWDVLEWKFPDWAAVTGPAINILKGAILAADRVMTVSQVLFPVSALLLVWCSLSAAHGQHLLLSSLEKQTSWEVS